MEEPPELGFTKQGIPTRSKIACSSMGFALNRCMEAATFTPKSRTIWLQYALLNVKAETVESLEVFGIPSISK